MSCRLHLFGSVLAAFVATAPAFGQEPTLEEQAQIPAGRYYHWNLTNNGVPMTLRVRASADTPLVLRVLNSRGHALRQGGQNYAEEVQAEVGSGDDGTATAVFTAGDGTWWIHVDNPGNREAEVELTVNAVTNEQGKPVTPPPSPDGPAPEQPAVASGGPLGGPVADSVEDPAADPAEESGADSVEDPTDEEVAEILETVDEIDPATADEGSGFPAGTSDEADAAGADEDEPLPGEVPARQQP